VRRKVGQTVRVTGRPHPGCLPGPEARCDKSWGEWGQSPRSLAKLLDPYHSRRTFMPCPKANSSGGRYFSLLCGLSVLYFPTYNRAKALAWSTGLHILIFQPADLSLGDKFRSVVRPQELGCPEHPDQVLHHPDHLKVVEPGVDLHGKAYPGVFLDHREKPHFPAIVAEI